MLAKILTDPSPAPSRIRVSIPPNADAAIRKALEKLPADRFSSAQEFSKALADAGFRHGVEATAVAAGRGLWNPLSAGLAAAAAAFALAFGWVLLRPEPPRPVSRHVISAAPAVPLETTMNYSDVAISPDGQTVVYSSSNVNPGEVVVRALNRLESVSRVPGGGPFLSPDGQWIGFQDNIAGPLQRASILGGPPQTITLPLGATLLGASWGPDDVIVYGLSGPSTPLWQVPAAGGEPSPLTATDAGSAFLPNVLPDGAGVLFVNSTSPGPADDQIAVLDLATGESRVIISSGTSPRYAASGHIVYAVGGTLWAAAFDPERLEVTSDPVPVVEGVTVKANGAASFDLSENGSLVYVGGGGAAGGQRIAVWVDRNGNEEALPLPPRIYDTPRLSPDGTRLAVSVSEADGSNPLWVFDVGSAAGLRLTQEGQTDTPVWTGDERIAFRTTLGIYTVAADGSGGPELLLPSAEGTAGDYPTSVTPDGQQLIFSRLLTPQHREIVQVPLQGEPAAQPILQGDFSRGSAEVSPDGRWLVYRSDQSGQDEVYVQPYPGPGPTVPVSVGGGTHVTWSPEGTELIYRLDDRVMAVSFTVEGDTPRIGPPTELFRGAYYSLGPAAARQYHIAPDGRFLMLKDAASQGAEDEALPPQVILVQNFFEELREVLPDN